MKVLITDDSATIRMMLKGLLKQLQITECLDATDGAEALELARSSGVQLMLLDIHMPNMDGLTCLAKLKENPATAGIPVIFITSDTVPAQLERARELGAHAYIKKPFRIEALREAIQAALPGWAVASQGKSA